MKERLFVNSGGLVVFTIKDIYIQVIYIFLVCGLILYNFIKLRISQEDRCRAEAEREIARLGNSDAVTLRDAMIDRLNSDRAILENRFSSLEDKFISSVKQSTILSGELTKALERINVLENKDPCFCCREKGKND